jgi:hypothetical protein
MFRVRRRERETSRYRTKLLDIFFFFSISVLGVLVIYMQLEAAFEARLSCRQNSSPINQALFQTCPSVLLATLMPDQICLEYEVGTSEDDYIFPEN